MERYLAYDIPSNASMGVITSWETGRPFDKAYNVSNISWGKEVPEIEETASQLLHPFAAALGGKGGGLEIPASCDLPVVEYSLFHLQH